MNKIIEEILTKVESGILENNTPKEEKKVFIKKANMNIEKEVKSLLDKIDEIFENV